MQQANGLQFRSQVETTAIAVFKSGSQAARLSHEYQKGEVISTLGRGTRPRDLWGIDGDESPFVPKCFLQEPESGT